MEREYEYGPSNAASAVVGLILFIVGSHFSNAVYLFGGLALLIVTGIPKRTR